MDQREQVRRAYFIEGKSIRRIAREGLHDRRTVRKFLRDAGPPRYTLKVPLRYPVLEPFLPIIQQWLREDESRPSKQRHTAHRIGVGLAALCVRARRPTPTVWPTGPPKFMNARALKDSPTMLPPAILPDTRPVGQVSFGWTGRTASGRLRGLASDWSRRWPRSTRWDTYLRRRAHQRGQPHS